MKNVIIEIVIALGLILTGFYYGKSVMFKEVQDVIKHEGTKDQSIVWECFKEKKLIK